MARRSGRSDARGFSLLEMLVVLVVMGLLTGMGYWLMVPALERAKVRRVVAVIAGDLQYAQVLAARHREPVVVIVNPSLKMYLIRDRGGTTVYRERFVGEDTDYGVQALSVTPSGSVEIFPNGVALATTTFTATIKDYDRQVKITRAGQVRILALQGG